MKFYIKTLGETAEQAQELRTASHFALTDVVRFAEEAAEYYHTYCDGWDSNWPVVFVVVDDRGEEHEVVVEREYDPTFHGTLKQRG